jgi:hypothetical protein
VWDYKSYLSFASNNIHAMMFRTECIRYTFPSTGLLVTLRGA